jgi:hypothetical protein
MWTGCNKPIFSRIAPGMQASVALNWLRVILFYKILHAVLLPSCLSYLNLAQTEIYLTVDRRNTRLSIHMNTRVYMHNCINGLYQIFNLLLTGIKNVLIQLP